MGLKTMQNIALKTHFKIQLCPLYFFAVLFLPIMIFGQSGGYSSQTFTIDEAIAENIKYVSTKLNAGMKIAVLNIEAENENLSFYIIDECGAFIKSNTKLSLVDKSKLPIIMQEKNISDLNEINESLALKIGKELGASSVILGNISKLGENYRFRVQALNTTDGKVLGTQSLNVKEDEILLDLLSSGDLPAKSVTDNAFNATEAKKVNEQPTRDSLELKAVTTEENLEIQKELTTLIYVNKKRFKIR